MYLIPKKWYKYRYIGIIRNRKFDFTLFLNPVILAIIVLFAGVVVYFVTKVKYINSSLVHLTNVLKGFKKGNIVYRFKELDDIFSNNPFISNYWIEFKNTLVFNEGISLKAQQQTLHLFNAQLMRDISLMKKHSLTASSITNLFRLYLQF